MVDAMKILGHIDFQIIVVPPEKLLCASDGTVSPLFFSRGIGVMDEGRLEYRFENIDQGMVDHPIPEGGHADQPLLGVVDSEISIGSRLVATAHQFSLDLKELCLQMKEKPARLIGPTATPPCLLESGVQVVETA